MTSQRPHEAAPGSIEESVQLGRDDEMKNLHSALQDAGRQSYAWNQREIELSARIGELESLDDRFLDA